MSTATLISRTSTARGGEPSCRSGQAGVPIVMRSAAWWIKWLRGKRQRHAPPEATPWKGQILCSEVALQMQEVSGHAPRSWSNRKKSYQVMTERLVHSGDMWCMICNDARHKWSERRFVGPRASPHRCVLCDVKCLRAGLTIRRSGDLSSAAGSAAEPSRFLGPTLSASSLGRRGFASSCRWSPVPKCPRARVTNFAGPPAVVRYALRIAAR